MRKKCANIANIRARPTTMFVLVGIFDKTKLKGSFASAFLSYDKGGPESLNISDPNTTNSTCRHLISLKLDCSSMY
jgi:hypothetical protein